MTLDTMHCVIIMSVTLAPIILSVVMPSAIMMTVTASYFQHRHHKNRLKRLVSLKPEGVFTILHFFTTYKQAQSARMFVIGKPF